MQSKIGGCKILLAPWFTSNSITLVNKYDIVEELQVPFTETIQQYNALIVHGSG